MFDLYRAEHPKLDLLKKVFQAPVFKNPTKPFGSKWVLHTARSVFQHEVGFRLTRVDETYEMRNCIWLVDGSWSINNVSTDLKLSILCDNKKCLLEFLEDTCMTDAMITVVPKFEVCREQGGDLPFTDTGLINMGHGARTSQATASVHRALDEAFSDLSGIWQCRGISPHGDQIAARSLVDQEEIIRYIVRALSGREIEFTTKFRTCAESPCWDPEGIQLDPICAPQQEINLGELDQLVSNLLKD